MSDEKQAKQKEEQKEEVKEGVKEEALSIDARLLSDAVIELNISRRNVGLYPPGHIRITSAIERAFDLLAKLFELRANIFLGITRDSLVIDDKMLDSRNPVFKECARSFHVLGIAGITFQAGLDKDELVKLHEMMTMADPPTGKAFTDAARDRGIHHLKLNPIDYSSFKFMEDELRDGGKGDGKGSNKDIWEDYVYGLLHGNLAVGDASGILMRAKPSELAEYIEKVVDEDKSLDKTAYDKVVASYMSARGDMKLSSEGLGKLVGIMDNLSKEKKEQFLDRAMQQVGKDVHQVESVLKDMTTNDLNSVTKFFSAHASRIPPSFKNVIDKFTEIKGEKDFVFDITSGKSSVVHDIELDDELASLFDDDHYKTFVSDEFQTQLNDLMNVKVKAVDMGIRELVTDVKDDVIDRVTSDIMIEVMDLKDIETEEFMKLLTTLAKMAGDFVDTGRFEEALNIYTAIRTHSFTGKFSQAAGGTVEYFFKSEPFVSRVLTAVRIWGRANREPSVRILRAFSEQVITPLLDSLADEGSASNRKFLLTVLMEMGSSIMPGVVARLSDERWYVVRNMLMLARQCGNEEYEKTIRKFVKHRDRRVWSEALRALFAFGSKHALPHLKVMLSAEDPVDREAALKVASAYRVSEIAPMLMELLSKKDLLGTGAFDKMSVVKALGEIGNPEALPHLATVLSAKPLLFKGYHEDLKIEIYKSLAGYPYESVRYLLDTGFMGSNPEIKSICKRIIKAAGKGGRGNG